MSLDPPQQERPLRRLIAGLGLALLAAALTARALSSGSGLELLHPGAQLLFDVVLLCGAGATLLARGLAGQGPTAPRAVLLATGGCALVLLLAARGAPHPDLAWRTALSWSALLLLALVVHDLAREAGPARLLAALTLALVATAGGLALHERVVERPALREKFDAGELERELGPMGASYRQAMEERVHSSEAAGPFLLPALLACATAMLLPLAATAAWGARRTARGAWAAGAAGLGLVLLLAFAQAGSKGGALALLAALGGTALLHPRLAPWRGRLLLALGVAGGLLALVGVVAWLRTPEVEGVGLSLAVRLEYWSAALGMARDHPLLGVGLNQFREFYVLYKPPRAEETLHAHNAALQVLAETGVVGLAAALALLAAWARAALSGLDALPVEPPARDAPDREPALWVLGGVGLGLVLVGAFGDVYSFDPHTRGHLLAVALALPASFAVAAAALRDAPPRWLAMALLGGSCAFLGDALLDFGLHHAGTATVAAVLVGLGAGVGRAQAPAGPTRAGAPSLALGGAAMLLVLVLLRGVVPGALDADMAREQAEEAYLPAQGRGPAADEARALALARLEEATERYPWFAHAWLERAAVEHAAGRPAAAERSILRALERSRRSSSAWSQLGDVRRDEGDLAGAAQAYEQAVALYPGDPGHLLALGLARAALRRPDGAATLAGALEAHARARQVSKQLAAAQLVALGRALAQVGGDDPRARDAAREALRRAVALDDEARAARAAGRRRPDPRRALTDDDRAAALRLLAHGR